MSAIPAWQAEFADELGEEWVESSPSPPGSPNALSPEHAPPLTASSLHAKRGSLRSLGQGAAARPLPRSRSASTASTPARQPSKGYRRESGMLSPPTSQSGSEGDAAEREKERQATMAAAGTCVVKDGEDTHGKAFPKNPFKGGRDMFAALALERMFEPPSPPVAAAEGEAPPSPMPFVAKSENATPRGPKSSTPPDRTPSDKSIHSEKSTTPTSSPASSAEASSRRVSHQYAPINPSRLSKSVTPSDNSFATTASSEPSRAGTLHIDDSRAERYLDDSNREHTGEVEDHPTTGVYDEPTTGVYDAEDATPGVYERDVTPGVYEREVTPYEREESPEVFERREESPAIHDDTPADYDEHEEDQFDHHNGDDDHDSLLDTTREIMSPDLEEHNEECAEHEGSVHSAPEEDNYDDDLPESDDRLGTTRVADPKYPFTFSAPIPHSPPLFDPSLEPLEGGEPSHSTLRIRSIRPASSNLGLRLFQNTYDTVTREHLSAMVDNIQAISPSPPSMPNAKDLREWSPAADSPSGSSRTMSSPSDSSGYSADSLHANKRQRIEEPTGPRGPTAIRDWRAQGRAMMERIRVSEPDMSVTSASRSGTASWASGDFSDRSRTRSRSGTPASYGASYAGGPTVDYDDIPPTPPIAQEAKASPVPEEPKDGPYRSNPSTASSTYLHRAEDMMSRIKQRMVSPATSTTEASSSHTGRDRVLSETDTNVSSEAEQRIPRHDTSTLSSRRTAPSPRKAASPRRIPSFTSEEDEVMPHTGSFKEVVAIDRPTSRTSVEGSGLPSGAGSRNDMNRYISSSTAATATTMSTSFVKHQGPREPRRMHMIRPDEVTNIVPERIGNMRFDNANNRWVRNSLGAVDEAGESRAGGSDESADPFAGFDSLGSSPHITGSRRSISPEKGSPLKEAVPLDESNDMELEHDVTPPSAIRPEQLDGAPVLRTPTPATPATPAAGTPLAGPLRSALRNPLSTPASAIKKQAAWHPDLTPRAARQSSAVPSSSSFKRSVSFSDSHIVREQLELDLTVRGDDSMGDQPSWLPSARTRRIQGVLADMADMSLDESSPSKPARVEEGDSDDTVPVGAFKSFRSFKSRGGRGAADATFLTECSFGVVHDRLVQLITDVQPFEPYWEQLRSIDLSNKGVESLVRLKEFLPVLDEARLNDNLIDYLSGIPKSVRTLHCAGNRLSSLTSVNHLQNLQYLDISRNQLDSVSQLECLRHLRELNADSNKITDLTGILGMDCLIKLSVSGNRIERVDLQKAKWAKLESLNLSRNRIRAIEGLENLSSLSTLNMDRNRLSSIAPRRAMQAMRTLRISDNLLTQLDLSLFPRVRTLFADDNALPCLTRSGAGGHRLENLSLRNQRVPRCALTPEDLGAVKRLYISGNRLDELLPGSSTLYSLVYLEAAACGLSTIAGLADRAPNLRVLNVNYNFLEALDGLVGLQRLRKLMAVGNRLGGAGSSGANARGLKGAKALEEVDMRMNPSTLSLYLPIFVPRVGGGQSDMPSHLNPHIQANTTTASVANTAVGGGVAVAGDASDWPALDAQFRRQLPDEWYSRRLAYRGMVMAACPEVRVLDGIEVKEGERRKAAALLAAALNRI